MAIISKQIGWSQESNLLYEILRQLNRLTSTIFGFSQAVAPKYKVYTALLSQSGVLAPTAIVLENTLGFNLPNWIYDFIGEYRMYVPGLNVPNKVALFIGQTGYNNALFHFYQQGDNININTINNINQPANDLISFPVTIEIRVYN
jgi:hypothetical protein